MPSVLATGLDDDQQRIGDALAGMALTPRDRLLGPPQPAQGPMDVAMLLSRLLAPNVTRRVLNNDWAQRAPSLELSPQQEPSIATQMPVLARSMTPNAQGKLPGMPPAPPPPENNWAGVVNQKAPNLERNPVLEDVVTDAANVAQYVAPETLAAGAVKLGNAAAKVAPRIGELLADEAGAIRLPGARYPLRRGAYSTGDVAADTIGPPPGMGHNNPPEPMLPEPAAEPPAAPPQTWAQGLPRARPAARSTDLPDIRSLPVDEAIEIARRQPHLIKAGNQSEGYYVGGPRDVQSKQALNKLRRDYDAYVAADPRGWNWYDRTRAGMDLSTGGDPVANDWQSAMHGQWSAGVDPGSELHFVLKENNAAIAGMPTKAARPAQHEAHMDAIASQDPSRYQLADKTEEYARHINANQRNPAGATGVTDFRNLRQWGFTEPGGEPQKGAATEAQHRFVDMETALAVDRANRIGLGGKNDWTGEQLQAAPWVRQKALDIMEQRPGLTYEQAFTLALRTITDFYPRHTYSATHEAQPGAGIPGHMPGAKGASQAEKNEFFNDPGSTWATAPMGRDAIYSGLGIPGTGVKMRVLPTEKMQGMYRNAEGNLETNLGEIARPLGTFQTPPPKMTNRHLYGKDFIGPIPDFVGPHPFYPFKRATDADRAIMDAGEHVRALIDAQEAGSWHTKFGGGPVNQSNSLYYASPPGKGPATLADLLAQQAAGAPHGLPDVSASSGGSISTQWWPKPEGGRAFDKAFKGGQFDVPGMAQPERVRVDSGLASLVDEWKQEGSGAATRKVLDRITATPELRAAFNNNEYIPERALAKFERDKNWASKWGAPRQDIQNLREIIGQSKGSNDWVDRVEAALKAGTIALPSVALLLTGAAAIQQEDAGRGAL